MFKKKNVLLYIIVMSMLALTLAGCTTGDNGGQTAVDPDGDGSLARVLDAGVFTVAGSGGYAPFNYMDGDNVIGFDVDTGEAIAQRLGVELDYITTAWDGITEGVRAGRYDAVLGSMAITPARLETVSFTVPYYYSGAQLVVLNDSGITDISEMEGKRIGIATGTTFATDADELGAEVILYEDDTQTLMELLNGRVDGVITDRLVVIRAMREMPGGDRLVMVGEILRLEEMALAISKNDVELLGQLNEILEAMHADGTMQQISESWFDGMDITIK